MRKILLVLAIITMFTITGCSSNDLLIDDEGMSVTEGKILEVREGNVLFLEISKERGEYRKEDRILVHYNKGEAVDLDNLEAGTSLYVPKVKDIVSLQYWPEDVTKIDGYDYVECMHVTNYINE